MVNTLPGRRYHKSVYELVLEAANTLGRNGRVFSTYDIIRYIRSKYPDCPYSDNSFKMHLQALSLNNKHAPKRWPLLYKRAFLIHLGGEKYKLAPTSPEEEKPVEQPPIQETPEISYSLSLERDLEDYLANNLEEIEPGLKLVERQNTYQSRKT